MGTLDGKVALVTGGSRGIGAAVALGLAKEGADVAIGYGRSGERAAGVVAEVEGLGRRAAAYQADQADEKQVEDMVNAVAQDFGRLDILINSAGIFLTGPVGVDGLDTVASGRQIDVNYRGVVAGVRAAARHLSDGGRIISLGTNAATGRVGFPGIGEYVATKAAVAAYSRGAARDLASRGITVNVIQPGAINTEMNPEHTEWAAQLGSTIPAGRYGRPDEVAALVAFLAGPTADYITGSTINIDGGMDA
jgi:3-oxoacyl-[acyl-carrier protein] reductase